MTTKQNDPPITVAIPSWIEPSLFEKVLQEIVDGYKQINDFKVKPALKPGENYATVMLRIEAEVELNDGTSLIIPLMLKTAHDSDVFLELTKNFDVFEVEATMYSETLPELEQLYKDAGTEVKFGAKSYELSTDKPYILLEDLRPKGFKNMNRLDGLDMDHTKAVLRKLAQWHAASAVRVATKGPYKSTISDGFYKGECREVVKDMFEGLGNNFLKCVTSYVGHELYHARLHEQKDDRLDELFEANKLDPSEFNVLNHGDCWSNNIMFQHDESGKINETYLVDYQVPRWGSPAQDLYYFLLTSAKYEFKLKQFDYFIKFYHEELEQNLKLLNYTKTIPKLKDIHIMLHRYNAWGYYTTVNIMSAILLDPTDKASLDNLFGDNEEFKLQMFLNPRYRKHMEEILPWLYNRGAL